MRLSFLNPKAFSFVTYDMFLHFSSTTSLSARSFDTSVVRATAAVSTMLLDGSFDSRRIYG
jgi:hypothetical protein